MNDQVPSLLIFATSLDPNSKSYILCQSTKEICDKNGIKNELIDLREFQLPNAGRAGSFNNPAISELKDKISSATHIFFGCAIYNYDVSSSAKNLVELVGNSLTEKTVGFLCCAGGDGSYMSVMAFANSLMLDFRCWIIPRFVYATDKSFIAHGTIESDTAKRIAELVGEIR